MAVRPRGAAGKAGARPLVIKRAAAEQGHAHHGGAWKVAYADFVTAMMAFFMLMWLLNATTEDQRRGLADYFSPTNVLARTNSGNGGPDGGNVPHAEGTQVTNEIVSMPYRRNPRPSLPTLDNDESDTPAEATRFLDRGDAAAPPERLGFPDRVRNTIGERDGPRAMPEDGEERALAEAAAQIEQAVREDPMLLDMLGQLLIDRTEEGLRIQIVDDERRPMFALGSAAPNERARALLRRIAPVLARLPNGIAVAGHTDSTPFRGPGRSNWDLSAERAQATRRILGEGGVADGRIQRVAGHADRLPLMADNPQAPSNRRIAVLVLRDANAAAAPPPQQEAARVAPPAVRIGVH